MDIELTLTTITYGGDAMGRAHKAAYDEAVAMLEKLINEK